MNSLKEIITDKKPHIISVNETHLGEDENIVEDRYHIIYNNKKEGKMGTIIGIRNDLKDKHIVIEKTSEEYEATWIKFTNNNNINVRIGNIYAPQECRTKEKVIKKMYKNIKKHILESRKLGEKIIITGDFNTKIGKYIKDNKKEISKFGKLFLYLLKNEEMEILNNNKKCKDMWTGYNKSILDYVIVNKEDTKYLNEMSIDENKEFTPYHVKGKRTIYSDHCAIIIKMNWLLASKTEQVNQCSISINTSINTKTLAKFENETSGNVLTNIAKQRTNVKNMYKKWNKYVKKIMKKCFTKRKIIKTKTKKVEMLYRKKRENKKEFRLIKEKNETTIRRYRIQKEIINEFIEEEEKKRKKDTINRNIKEIKENGGVNANIFWEFKKRMDNKTKKDEEITAIKNEKGELETDIEKIKEIFKNFYIQLFKPNDAGNTEEEEKAREIQDILFESIIRIAENDVECE